MTPQELQELKDFISYLNTIGSETVTEKELLQLYDFPFVLMLHDKTVVLPFCANTFNNILDCLTNILGEEENR